MKKSLHIFVFTTLLICSYINMFSQQVTIDGSVPLNLLIENHLANSCVEISNVSSTINGNIDGLNSYGSFNSNNSNFPLNNGIVISTGSVESGGNTINNNDLSEGTSAWGTDPDIETALGIGNTINATSIEFDFIALSSQIQFRYILASEEYTGTFPCNAADGFAFLIKPSNSTGPYQNIALIPGESTPIYIRNVHTEVPNVCPAQNELYYDGSFSDTNYNGQTTTLTAFTNITPNTSYHVKLIVADQSDISPDPNIDTAVFIETSTFTELELGDDITTCSSNVLLNGEIDNPLATYTWYKDGSEIIGATNATYNAIETGLYAVEINVTGITCTLSDSVNITIDTELTTNPISDYSICQGNSIIFDLPTKDSDVINAIQDLPVNYSITYHTSDTDAKNNLAPITTSTTPQTIYVRIEDTNTGCLVFGTFDLIISQPPTVSPNTLELCDDSIHDNILNNIDLTQKDRDFTSGDNNLVVTYHGTSSNAITGNNPILGSYSNATSNQVYVRVTNIQTGCFDTTTLDIVVNDSAEINYSTQYIDACDKDYDGFAVFDLTSIIDDVLMGNPNIVLPVTYHTSILDAQTGSNPIPNPENYTNTDIDVSTGLGEQTIYIRAVDATSLDCPSIVNLEIHTNLLLTGTNIPELGFAICDDSLPYGEEDFNLNSISSVIINDLPNEISINYYESITDRANSSPALDPAIPYTVLDSNPRTLYISLKDETGCVEEAEIILRVDPIITFAPIDPVPYCDNDDDGTVTVNLASLDDIVTGGNTNFSVRYFPDEVNAENGTNSHPSFYEVTDSEIIFAQISNIETGCSTVNSFELNIIPAPTVTDPSDIIICDMDSNGISSVNLRDKVPEVVSNPTNYDIHFFTDLAQIDDNNNAIPDTNLDNYPINATTTIVYVKVEETGSSSSGCYGTAILNIILNTLPVIPNITPYQICEDDNDLREEFRFLDKDVEILDGQIGKEVLYFSDENDAINRNLGNGTLLDKNSYFNNSPSQTIYVRVENISDTSCFSTGSFTIQVASNPIYNKNFTNFSEVCENGIGEHTLNLADKIQEISIGGPADLSVTFHLTETAAMDENATPLPDQYTTSNRQGQLYARIESSANSCVVIEVVRFTIFPNPIITQLSIEPGCDIDGDGTGVSFNLDNVSYTITNARFDTFSATYYLDEALTSPITNTTNYLNTSNPQTIYINIKNNATPCNTTLPLELVVNLSPTINTIDTVTDCVYNTNTYDLSQISILAVNDANTVNISYHYPASGAINNTAVISNNIFNYPSTGDYNIGIRVVDPTTGCSTISSFILQINPNPIANTPTPLEDCDDDFDGFFEFDLQLLQSNNIRGSQDPSLFSVTYYNELPNTEAGIDAINNNYPAINGETIFARIENNETGCYATTQFNVIVNPKPTIPINDIITLCTNDLPKTISAETGNIGDTYFWINNLTGRTETTPEINLTLTDISDDWLITVTKTTGCSHTIPFKVIESDEATINLTNTVNFADPNSITVEVSGIGDYVFSLDGGKPQASNFFNNVTLGPHVITVIDLNGCTSINSDVFVIDIPKFVTPNNDGNFDTWHIVGIERLPGTIVYIYDRYGKLLKTLPHTSEGWDGTFNGENMPANDYWFVANVIYEGEEFQVKGHFALKR